MSKTKHEKHHQEVQAEPAVADASSPGKMKTKEYEREMRVPPG